MVPGEIRALPQRRVPWVDQRGRPRGHAVRPGPLLPLPGPSSLEAGGRVWEGGRKQAGSEGGQCRRSPGDALKHGLPGTLPITLLPPTPRTPPPSPSFWDQLNPPSSMKTSQLHFPCPPLVL